MTRRVFAGLVGLLTNCMAQLPKKKKFYITGLFHTKELNDCSIPPIECYGVDRVDALMNWVRTASMTVWTEEEWKSSDQASFRAMCNAQKEIQK